MISPPICKNLKTLERALFTRTIQISALRVLQDVSNPLMSKLRKLDILLHLPKIRTIVPCSVDPQFRLLLLRPDFKTRFDTPEIQNIIKSYETEIVQHKLQLDYDFWSSEQILSSILPEEIEVPSAFETIGHIAHLNLRECHMPFRNLIGQVILDKNKHILTVVNKVDSIDHTFRFFKMEILAGEDNLNAELKESGCKFKFDYSKVYWNSRLMGEHQRIVNDFCKASDFICDVFCGIGPFTIPIAKNVGATLFSNDLNPSSYEYLVENIKLNKVQNRVLPFNTDGREFIRQSIKNLNNNEVLSKLYNNNQRKLKQKDSKDGASISVKTIPTGPRYFSHYIMNLPNTAIEFLDAFKGLYMDYPELKDTPMPLIHCHCFSSAENVDEDVVQRCSEVLGYQLQNGDIEKIHHVRKVSPKKDMLCISFRLPKDVAFGANQNKKIKLDDHPVLDQ